MYVWWLKGKVTLISRVDFWMYIQFSEALLFNILLQDK